MIRYRSISVVMFLVMGLSLARGQDASNPQQPEETPAGAQPQQPAPAYGPDNSGPSVTENPPISGLDVPNLEPHAAPLSYLQPGAHVSESVDSNIQNSLGGSETQSISRGEGSVVLRRLWSHYDLSLNYLGGVGYYNVHGIGLKQVEELGFYQKIFWKRGYLGVRDAFSYQPEGTFGSSYGAVGAEGAGLGNVAGFFGGSALGALGQVPRIMNLSLVDAVEALTPKSSITGTVGYGFVHFLQNEPGTNASFIGNSQVSGQVGYDRILGPHDQGALVYGYQDFNFSTGVSVHSNVVQLMWGHRISGRMDFLVGAGPQFVQLPGNDLVISAAGQARLHYEFKRVGLAASYEHFLSNGGGFFAGAQSDIATLSASRPLSRVWSAFTDIGYSRNSRAATNPCAAIGLNCAGVNASVYQYGFAGVGVHRMFGRNFHGYASYQFNELSFEGSLCTNVSSCSHSSQRQVGTIGLDWTPRPIRLD